MKIKIINLLKDMSDGKKVPKKIKSPWGTYELLDGERGSYYAKVTNHELRLLDDVLFVRGFLNAEVEIIEPILDDVEKKYLSAVVKPFRNEITSIMKNIWLDRENIEINYTEVGPEYECTMCLPSFPKDAMYKGMRTNHEYTLEELGL